MPADVVDRQDVLMRQGRGRSRLPLEAREPLGIGREHVGQHLDGDVPSQSRVVGPIHLTHPAGANQASTS